MKISALILVLWFCKESESLVAYDCVGQPTKITPVSVSRVADCQPPAPPNHQEVIPVQILQHKHFDSVLTISCLIEVSTLIAHCGMSSHSTIAKQGFSVGSVLRVTLEQCQRMHSSGVYETPNRRVISGLKINSTAVHNLLEAGSVWSDEGSCDGATYYEAETGITYSDVVVRKSYKITLRGESSIIDLNDGRVKLSSGYSFPIVSLIGFDPEYGYSFWSITESTHSCSSTSHIVLYQGSATITVDSSGKKVLLVNTTEHALAIGLTSANMICMQHGYLTDHPKLTVVISSTNTFYFVKQQISPESIDMFLYTNSKFLYVEKHYQGQLISLYAHFHEHMCLIKYQLLNQLVSLAYTSPEEFAWAYSHKPGVTAILRGEVIYLIECPPTTVEIRSVALCYQEIPVTHQNESKFVAPRTRILSDRGVEIDCNPLAPALFQLSDQWFQLNPHPNAAIRPTILTPESDKVWSYVPIMNLMTSGLYSQEDLERYQKRLMFSSEKGAISNIIISRAGGQQMHDQDLDIGQLLSGKTLDDIHISLLERIYGGFWNISIHVAAFSGMIFIIMLVKSTLNMLINGTLLFRTYGCGIQVLSALWGTLAKHLLYFKLMSEMLPKDRPPEDVERQQASAPEHEDKSTNEVIECLITTPENRLYPKLA